MHWLVGSREHLLLGIGVVYSGQGPECELWRTGRGWRPARSWVWCIMAGSGLDCSQRGDGEILKAGKPLNQISKLPPFLSKAPATSAFLTHWHPDLTPIQGHHTSTPEALFLS